MSTRHQARLRDLEDRVDALEEPTIVLPPTIEEAEEWYKRQGIAPGYTGNEPVETYEMMVERERQIAEQCCHRPGQGYESLGLGRWARLSDGTLFEELFEYGRQMTEANARANIYRQGQ